MSSPMLPAKEDPFADRPDECNLHSGPVSEAYDFREVSIPAQQIRQDRDSQRAMHSKGLLSPRLH